jgi:hypothetical protein
VQVAVYFQGNLIGAQVIAAYYPNTGYLSWSIPANLAPGTYQLAIGFVSTGTLISSEFTIRPAPECLSGCSLVAFNMPACSPYLGIPPVGACGYSTAEAFGLADDLIRAQLGSQCFAGYAISPGSVVIDYTLLPIGTCLSGFTGPYVVEVAGYACCCPQGVPTRRPSWGDLKSHYR